MWTWTQAANVIFIEQPGEFKSCGNLYSLLSLTSSLLFLNPLFSNPLLAGVGFSYSETPSDYTVGDYQASQDVLSFMLGFLERYPQYANRPFFVSGESVSLLTFLILHRTVTSLTVIPPPPPNLPCYSTLQIFLVWRPLRSFICECHCS